MPSFSLSRFHSSVLLVPRSRCFVLRHAREEVFPVVSLAKSWIRFEEGKRRLKAKKDAPLFSFLVTSPSSFPPPKSLEQTPLSFFVAPASYRSRASILLAKALTLSHERSSLLDPRTRSQKTSRLRAESEAEKRTQKRRERSRWSFFFFHHLASFSTSSSYLPLFFSPFFHLFPGPRCHLRGHPGLVVLRRRCQGRLCDKPHAPQPQRRSLARSSSRGHGCCCPRRQAPQDQQ